MPAIKPRTTQKHFVRHITRLYRENNETLFSYAAFIGEGDRMGSGSVDPTCQPTLVAQFVFDRVLIGR